MTERRALFLAALEAESEVVLRSAMLPSDNIPKPTTTSKIIRLNVTTNAKPGFLPANRGLSQG